MAKPPGSRSERVARNGPCCPRTKRSRSPGPGSRDTQNDVDTLHVAWSGLLVFRVGNRDCPGGHGEQSDYLLGRDARAGVSIGRTPDWRWMEPRSNDGRTPDRTHGEFVGAGAPWEYDQMKRLGYVASVATVVLDLALAPAAMAAGHAGGGFGGHVGGFGVHVGGVGSHIGGFGGEHASGLMPSLGSHPIDVGHLATGGASLVGSTS